MSREDITNNITEAAFREFMEYGFEKASMRRIASAVGITAAALYKHFQNKEEMFAALVEPTIQEFRQIYDEMNNRALEQLPFSEAEAMHYADTLDVFFSAGWKRLFGI